NTLKIAEMCNVDIDVGTYHFPELKVEEGLDLNAHFEKKCWDGFKRRLGRIQSSYEAWTGDMGRKYEDRLRYELDVIKQTGFASYFLIVADFIHYAKSQEIPVGPGRGSAAGSLIAYCLN
ncbi:MAG TPA: DNA polymerase III subunit alpha, partial [Syntrophorhabdus aromaticivorans]|nr:DNA polymerase III subunit alpha [Syntrophorhabdus aromaticivorans]